MRRQPSARISPVIDGVANPRPARAGGRGPFHTEGIERWNNITGYLVRAKKWTWLGARRRPKHDLCTTNWPPDMGQKPKRRKPMPLHRSVSNWFEPTTIWSMAIDTARLATQSSKRNVE